MVDRLPIVMLALVMIAGSVRARQPGSAEPDPRVQMLEAFEAGEFERAKSLAEAIIAADPGDARTRYNLAVILARLGDEDASVEALIDAISFGFVDLHEMDRDPSLARVRATDKYQRVIERWGVLLDAVGRSRFEDAATKLGPGYARAEHADQRLYWLSAVEGDGFDQAQREATRVASWCRRIGLFSPADPARPDPWVTVIIPTVQDFAALVPYAMVGGTYSRDEKRLVTRDIGPTLRHEFFHVLHWRHMDRLGQVHPIWVQEGMASLLEDVELDEQGGYSLQPSWRTNIAKRMERSATLRPLAELVAVPRDRFVSVRPSGNYAHARAVMMFLTERGALSDFYRALVAGWDDDPTGAVALEVAMGRPLADIDREFRAWLAGLPEVAEQSRPPEGVLGVPVTPGNGAGPVVGGGVDLRPDAPLRAGDAIVAIQGRSVATLDDLYRVLGEFEPGDEVSVTVARSGKRLELRVTLRSREHPGVF